MVPPYRPIRHIALAVLLLAILAQSRMPAGQAVAAAIDTSGLMDSAHHWWDITDEDHVISPQPEQHKYPATAITDIADNMLRYQKTNGGWPKNYDMQAVLTAEQKTALAASVGATNTTIDNGATHSHIAYLAQAFAVTRDARYSAAARRGIEYLLSAQYPNGGWPQFYPEKKGYARFITFNDGAMIGVMEVFHAIVRGDTAYAFVGEPLRAQVTKAFDSGVECILRCQITDRDTLTVWCQQHDNVTLLPQKARTFEPAAIANQESAEIVEFLMSIKRPSRRVVAAVRAAVQWFTAAQIRSLRVDVVKAPAEKFQYHTATTDKVVVEDAGAPPIWPRYSELETHRPLFSGRNWNTVYSMAEVERERRTGYAWYTYAPAKVLKKFPKWEKKTASAATGQ